MSEATDACFAAFEAAVDQAFEARLRSDDAACRAMWSALANTSWSRSDGSRVGHTFRHASQIIAGLRGRGRDLDWYCSGPPATVSDEIKAAMAGEGWTPEPVVG